MSSHSRVPVTAAIPVKPFDQAKRRLSDVLTPHERRNLGERLARRTVETVRAAGVRPLVLSADEDVTKWARSSRVDVVLDEGSSLNRAAAVACDHIMATGEGWMIVHADLPVLSVREVAHAATLVGVGTPVLAPSSDGGTSMVGSTETVRFAYGPGSFRRHLAAMASSGLVVLTSVGWALDLDTPADLLAVRRHPSGGWLGR